MENIEVRGARTHNLKNINLIIPRDKLIVITGLSGSGKSSLAFDTLYAEGQRRYVESLSAYARQFLSLMEKPDVDHIEGLSPAISIEQKSTSHNPRSTVGTITEIHDYLRLLFARVGEPRCPDDGLSFTEFTYQLLQGYDFLHLYETKGCKLQMGGSDQWGNITTGAELIRRTNGGEVFALTCPLITKADGGKFGKTESGNIWLDPRYTSPYKFYQFWLNVSDSDAERYIKIFTSIEKEEIEALIAEHQAAPHLRLLQKRLAKEVTVMVHSEEDYNAAVDASNILFGNATSDALRKLDEDTLLAVFEGVPQFEISRDALAEGVKAVDLFVDNAAVFASKGEMRKLVQGGGVSLNKEKLTAFDQVITTADLLDEKYLLVQRGKKNYFLLIAK